MEGKAWKGTNRKEKSSENQKANRDLEILWKYYAGTT